MKRCLFSIGLVVLGFALTACGGGASDDPDLSPGPQNRVFRIFEPPFERQSLNGAPFDHNLPLAFEEDENTFMLPWRGACIRGIWDGHNGHDWTMPRGTPLHAVADAEVIFAGPEPPFHCNGNLTSALVVQLRHEVDQGEVFESHYVHLSEVQVEAGQEVEAGQQIGLSGATGCANGPHLHFSVWRLTHTNNGRRAPIDPFGWEGPGTDPWALHPDGAESLWLWKRGAAPQGDFCCSTPELLDVADCPR